MKRSRLADDDTEVEAFGVCGVLQAVRGLPETHGYRRADNDGGAPVDAARVYGLLGERAAAKAARDYVAADSAREELRSLGVDEFELSFSKGRWDHGRWGRSPADDTHGPSGAALWARL